MQNNIWNFWKCEVSSTVWWGQDTSDKINMNEHKNDSQSSEALLKTFKTVFKRSFKVHLILSSVPLKTIKWSHISFTMFSQARPPTPLTSQAHFIEAER